MHRGCCGNKFEIERNQSRSWPGQDHNRCYCQMPAKEAGSLCVCLTTSLKDTPTGVCVCVCAVIFAADLVRKKCTKVRHKSVCKKKFQKVWLEIEIWNNFSNVLILFFFFFVEIELTFGHARARIGPRNESKVFLGTRN